MLNPLKNMLNKLGSFIASRATGAGAGLRSASGAAGQMMPPRSVLLAVGVVGAVGYGIYTHPPVAQIARGEVGLRSNQLTGSQTLLQEGAVLVLPGLHNLCKYPLRDQTYRPMDTTSEAPFQSNEGLSLGVDLTVRYAINQQTLLANAGHLPDDINSDLVDPMVQGIIYKIFTRYTVREIFSTKRQEIQQQIESELKPRLIAEGLVLRSVMVGKINLPEDYKRGMENLLAAELESEKMRYTLELKEKHVKESELEASAEKVRRETEAAAAASEQIIAARAQEEAMKHVLPFKQKQIEQRQLEAEAEKVARVKMSEGMAQARVIEAQGEADSRRKLADAEAYRQELVGKIASEQLERDGALLTKNPLLIQKTMADKLSDKVSVIIAPAPASGGFIGSALLGANKVAASDATNTDSAAQ